MKKYSIYALMGAIALAGSVGFSSCSSSSDDIIDNPDFIPEENMVKTQFAISLQDNIAKTRMGAGKVQASGQVSGFLGMTGIKLVPFHTTTEVPNVTSTSSVLSGYMIDLGNIDASTSGTETESNKVYTDVAVPVTTNHFVLYGSAGQTAGFENGDLTVAGLGSPSITNLSGVSFTPVQICSSPTEQADYRKCKNLLALLNRVAGSSTTTGETWATTTVLALQSLYHSFTSSTVGSSQYVQDMLEDIYNAVNTLATGDATTPGHDLAAAIQANITDALSYTESSTTYNCTANTIASSKLTLSDSYTNYPTSLNLPNGAARITFSSGSFSDATTGSIGTLNAGALSSYVYPANLQYFVLSDILTAESTVLNGTISTFATAKTAFGDSPQTEVTARTRSILLNKQIQYGVGRLEVSVNKIDGTKYFDNLGNEVNVSAGYTLTGVLIGDQKAVGWNFAQTGTTSYTIYDKMIAGETTGSTVTTTAASATNHTLVLETLDYVDATTTNSVNVALEFVNNGADFIGADGVIPAGATFYLVGTLNPSEGGSNYGEGEGKTKKVFAQDFVTKATFTIKTGADTENASAYSGTPAGLGQARLGLPDLRLPQMELGLSVDLQWTPGLTFNVDI